jgi:hypothetical protein
MDYKSESENILPNLVGLHMVNDKAKIDEIMEQLNTYVDKTIIFGYEFYLLPHDTITIMDFRTQRCRIYHKDNIIQNYTWG